MSLRLPLALVGLALAVVVAYQVGRDQERARVRQHLSRQAFGSTMELFV